MNKTRWLGPWRLNRTTGQWWRHKVVPLPVAPYVGFVMVHPGRIVTRLTVTHFGPVVAPRVKRG